MLLILDTNPNNVFDFLYFLNSSIILIADIIVKSSIKFSFNNFLHNDIINVDS